MKPLPKSKPLHLKNQNGQVAIFVALIFQVLFVFFAMVVNVGLLVHHKINLQNSVDLAAYYGAMKQAEVLNSIAHINYQIRQSWKLMTFRYRHLGMGGFEKNDGNPVILPPYERNVNPGANSPGRIRDDSDTETKYEPSFCMAYPPFDLMFQRESYCKFQNRDIPLPGVPSGSAAQFDITGLGVVMRLANQAANQAITNIRTDCKKKMAYNSFLLASFIYGYKMDVYARKKVLFKIANGISRTPGDFFDLDGESALTGVKNTLEKNLTAQNRAGRLNFEFLNSMGVGSCARSGDDEGPPPWLNEIFFFPAYDYVDKDCNGREEITAGDRKFLNSTRPEDHPRYANITEGGPVGDIVDKLIPYLEDKVARTEVEKQFKSSMGFEKDPWCMAYVRVKASSEPSIPFSPFGSVKLTATAYAKPFGGRIGPWYKENWTPGQSGQSQSNVGQEVDKVGYVKVGADSWFPVPPPAELVKKMRPNHSRYVGDQLGHRSNLTSAYMQKAISETADNYSVTWWNHLTFFTPQDYLSPAKDSDIIAWDSIRDVEPSIRPMEISAIVPDQFDLTYYSIDPDFYRNYQLRLERNTQLSGMKIRGDLGQRSQSRSDKLKKFSIKDQFEVMHQKNPFDFQNKLKYYAVTFAELLTSWQGLYSDQPIFDATRFGKCEQDMNGKQIRQEALVDPARDDQTAIGSCLKGGRVGYSVKLVDGAYLNSPDLELGGRGVTGEIKNQPPP